MKQVLDSKGEAVSNLFLRGNSLYWRQEISGKKMCRAIPVRRLKDGEAVKADMIKQALAWMKMAEEHALRGHWDLLDQTKRKREVCLIGELVAEYRRVTRGHGEPRAATVEQNVAALLRLLRDATGKEPEKLSAGILTKDVLQKYREAKIKQYGDNDSTRRSVLSTVIQARSVVQKKLCQDYTVELPDLVEFRDYYLGKYPTKETPLPPVELRTKTLRAARRLWIRRDPMYLAFVMAYQLGMRSEEIAEARWNWIEEHMGKPRMALRNRPEDGFLIKGVRPGNVPVHPAVLKRMLAFKGAEPTILPSDKPTTRKNIIERDLAAWMSALGWDALDTTKRAHELRRLFGSRVWAKYGQEECFARMRHKSFSTTERCYLNLNLNLTKRELVGI